MSMSDHGERIKMIPLTTLNHLEVRIFTDLKMRLDLLSKQLKLEILTSITHVQSQIEFN